MREATQEEKDAAYRMLPRPVREYLVSTKLWDLTQGFGKQFALHVDVVAALSQLITYMLLGLLNPSQLQQALRELQIPPESATAIMNELNQKLFKPLQEEIKNAPSEEPEPEEAATPTPAPAPVAPAPRILVVPPAVFQPAPAPVTPAPAPIAAPVTAPVQSAPLAPPAPRPVPPPAPQPPMPTINKIPNPIPPQAAPPAPPSPREALHDVLKNYGVDPYRETPE